MAFSPSPAPSVSSRSQREHGSTLEGSARLFLTRATYKVFGSLFITDEETFDVSRLARVVRRTFAQDDVRAGLELFSHSYDAVRSDLKRCHASGKDMYSPAAQSIEIDGLVKLARPAHGWWAARGEGLDELRFIAPLGSQELPETSAGAGAALGAGAGAELLAPPLPLPLPLPQPQPQPQPQPSVPDIASEASLGSAPESPPFAARRVAQPSVTPPEFRRDASMYVLLEAWAASPRSPQLSKLLQLERAICVVVARSGRPLCDCIMGVIAAGPHVTDKTCALFYETVQANAAGLPHLHKLCSLRRFLGVMLEGTSVVELELAVEGLRSDMGRLDTKVSMLDTKVSLVLERFDQLLGRLPPTPPAPTGDT